MKKNTFLFLTFIFFAVSWQGVAQDCEPGSIPFQEGFENSYPNSEVLAGCWSQESTTGSGQWVVMNEDATYDRTSRTGDSYISLVYGEEDWIFYPLDLTSDTTYELSFYARQDATSGAEVMAGFGVIDSAEAMTAEIIPTSGVTSNEYEEFSGEFTPDSDGVYYIGIKGTTNYIPYYLTVDDISVIEVVAEPVHCDAPTNLTVEVMGPTFSQVTWAGNAEDYEIAWGISPYEPGDAHGTQFTTGNTNSYYIGTVSKIEYDVYLRAICEDSESNWVDTSFISPDDGEQCQSPSGMTVEVITEDGVTISWSPANEGDDEWVISLATLDQTAGEGISATVTDIPTYTATELDAGTIYVVYLRTICSEEDSSDWASSGSFQTLDSPIEPENCDAPTDTMVSNITPTAVTINWTASATASEGYEINVYDSGTPTLAGTMTVATGVTTVDITNLQSGSDYDVVVTSKCTDGTRNGSLVTFTTTEVCDAVTDVEVSEITTTTAIINWTASATAEEGYVVAVYEAGADMDTDTAVVTETLAEGVTTLDVEELTPDTEYDVYVTAVCGEDNSVTSEAVTFTTEPTANVGDFDVIKLTVYPNPVSSNLNISAAKVIDEVQVYNILGQRVMTNKSNNTEVALDVSSLPSATYLLKVNVEGVINTIKFVKK